MELLTGCAQRARSMMSVCGRGAQVSDGGCDHKTPPRVPLRRELLFPCTTTNSYLFLVGNRGPPLCWQCNAPWARPSLLPGKPGVFLVPRRPFSAIRAKWVCPSAAWGTPSDPENCRSATTQHLLLVAPVVRPGLVSPGSRAPHASHPRVTWCVTPRIDVRHYI